MARPTFINLYNTLDEALSEYYSPDVEFRSDIGIQLLPNNTYPYKQTTDKSDGINLEDWSVGLMKVCGDNPITEGSSNYLLYSNDFNNVVWDINQSTYTSGKLIPNTFNAAHWMTQTITKDAVSKEYTVSAFVKSAEYNRLYLRINDANGYIIAYFDTISQLTTFFDQNGSFTNILTSYTDEGDGWFRFFINATSSNDTEIEVAIGVVDDFNNFSFIGNDSDGLLIKNAQLSEGGLSDYVDTTDSIVITPDFEGLDVTSNFAVTKIFYDTNGYPQFEWELLNVPYDMGTDKVYLKIYQSIGEEFYSTPFFITDNDSDRTTRLDYKIGNDDTMQSIQFRMWYRQQLKEQELKSYYETSTRNTVNTTVKSQKYELWRTDDISNDLLIQLSEVFENKYVYLNLYRAYLFEGIEPKIHEGDENFEDNEIKIAFNKSDIFDPNYIPPVIPETGAFTDGFSLGFEI